MMKKKFILFAAACLAALIMGSCAPAAENSEVQTNVPEATAPSEVKRLEINTMTHREGELVFSCSPKDFIDSFNSYYRKDMGSDFFKPIDEWKAVEYDTSIHYGGNTLVYTFKADENIWSLPSVSLYVPPNSDYIQEVAVEFDDHSYSSGSYSAYERLCFYALKVFFGDLPDESITGIYRELNQLAYDKFRAGDPMYGYNPTPHALYYRGEIGVYPYFATGAKVRLCIIPVNEEFLEEYAERGVPIQEIQ